MAGMTPGDGNPFGGGGSNADFQKKLNKVYAWYTDRFLIFVVLLVILEQIVLPRAYVG